MKAKKYCILVIVPFSILIVLWPAQQITGETDLSVKDKKAGRIDFSDLIPGETDLSAKDKKTGSNLTALQKSACSYQEILPDGTEIVQVLVGGVCGVDRLKPCQPLRKQPTRG